MEFRPTADDERIIASVMHEGEQPADVIRRALRLLEREARLDHVRRESERLAADTPSQETGRW
jgi:antitoxin ParD1/3/4